jgi:TatD DNase family protein
VKWIDGHCHLADPRFDPERADVIARSEALGIGAWVQGGVSPEDWDRQAKLKAAYGGEKIYTSYGLHPWWVTRAGREEIQRGLELLAQRLPEADAAGELGLDLGEKNGGPPTLELQAGVFREQLKIARAAGKPLVLHVVRAHTQALDILKEFSPYLAGGLVHSFSGSRETAAQYLEQGFLLSISGGVTKPGFQTLKKALNSLPPERLVLETDAPDQPVEGVTGLNEPCRLVEIARAAAAIRGGSAEELLETSARNIRKLFGRPS